MQEALEGRQKPLPNNDLAPLPGLIFVQLPTGGCALRAGPRLLAWAPPAAISEGEKIRPPHRLAAVLRRAVPTLL